MPRRPPTDDQLPLPIAAAPPVVGQRERRGRRKRPTDRQLWLFAPYMQPELPLPRATPDNRASTPDSTPPPDAVEGPDP